jgi:hypothetical protein
MRYVSDQLNKYQKNNRIGRCFDVTNQLTLFHVGGRRFAPLSPIARENGSRQAQNEQAVFIALVMVTGMAFRGTTTD